LLVNPGSVGCPAYTIRPHPPPHVSETGSPHARYALLSREENRRQWQVDLIAVSYDWDQASARAAANDLSRWARAQATGYMS
jgi:hypothetical protein